MMICVSLRIERRERQPLEGRREMSGPHSFPEQTTPLDVIVAVEVAAADGLRGVLQLAEDESDDDCAEEQERGGVSRLLPEETFAPLRRPLDLDVCYRFLAGIRHNVKQESEARSQEPEAKKICNRGLRLIILNSGFWILTPVFYSSLNFLIRSRSVIGLMGLVRWALKPD